MHLHLLLHLNRNKSNSTNHRSLLTLQQIRMISHSDMRQADINRVKKAREHLKAATTLLNNIKWENIDGMEDLLMIQSKTSISDADRSLDHITKIQDTEK